MFSKVDELANHAMGLGVSAAKAISSQKILVEDRLAGFCSQQPCPGYAKSLNCPPHLMQPGQFRKLLAGFHTALVFKFDVPTSVLISDDRQVVVMQVHQTAAELERKALALGAAKARGLAAGSCWQVFCADQGDCPALNSPEKCRFPDQARPSLSGLGVNVFQLCADLDWPIKKITKQTDPDEIPMGLMAGLVLLG